MTEPSTIIKHLKYRKFLLKIGETPNLVSNMSVEEVAAKWKTVRLLMARFRSIAVLSDISRKLCRSDIVNRWNLTSHFMFRKVYLFWRNLHWNRLKLHWLQVQPRLPSQISSFRSKLEMLLTSHTIMFLEKHKSPRFGDFAKERGSRNVFELMN